MNLVTNISFDYYRVKKEKSIELFNLLIVNCFCLICFWRIPGWMLINDQNLFRIRSWSIFISYFMNLLKWSMLKSTVKSSYKTSPCVFLISNTQIHFDYHRMKYSMMRWRNCARQIRFFFKSVAVSLLNRANVRQQHCCDCRVILHKFSSHR